MVRFSSPPRKYTLDDLDDLCYEWLSHPSRDEDQKIRLLLLPINILAYRIDRHYGLFPFRRRADGVFTLEHPGYTRDDLEAAMSRAVNRLAAEMEVRRA